MRTALVVPIAVDVLVVDDNTPIARPQLDFSKLPYTDGTRDINPARPFTTERISTAPFEEDAAGWLPAGVHVRWEFPEPLTHGRQQGRSLRFPRLPNRWLVRAPDQAWWVVESDYVHPEGARVSDLAVPYLLTLSQRKRLGGSAAYRYVGRQIPLAQWRRDPTAQYLGDVTAVGWGHPSFATFYPNCWSMFGFNAPQAKNSTAGELYGWYANPDDDPLHRAVSDDAENSAARIMAEFGMPVETMAVAETRATALLCTASWLWPGSTPQPKPNPSSESNPEDEYVAYELSGSVRSITLGSTGAAALARSLAPAVARTSLRMRDPATGEPTNLSTEVCVEALEAVTLRGQFEPGQPDTARQLAEARHAREFVASRGGWTWVVRAEVEPSSKTHGVEERGPSEVYSVLARLNASQAELDRLARKQDTLSTQLFADWSKYLESKYPPRGSRDDYPDPNEVRAYIERTSLGELQANFDDALLACRDAVEQAMRARAILATHDVRSLMLRAEQVREWDGLAEAASSALEGRARAAASGLRADPEDDARRSELLELINASIVASTPGVSTTRQEHGSEPEDDEERIRAVLIPRLGPGYDELWERWTAQSRALAESVVAAQRTRARFEVALGDTVAVAPRNRHVLEPTPGPRFWEPRDPVLLIRRDRGRVYAHGEDLLPGPAKPAVVECGADFIEWLPKVLGPWVDPTPHHHVVSLHAPSTSASDQLRRVGTGALSRDPALTSSLGGAPVFVDWKVQFFEEPGLSTEQDGRPAHHAVDALVQRYQLVDQGPELTPQAPSASHDASRMHVVSGRSMLSNHAVLELEAALGEDHGLERPQWQRALEIHRKKGLPWRAEFQSVSLSGFHESLLMREAAFPLPIRDPLGFSGQQPFAARVRALVGRHTGLAPRPQMPFKPVRAGRLRVLALRFVDAFGVVSDLSAQQVESASPQHDGAFLLPPRLVPPARLAMRWLSASQPDHESMDHPVASPVCGWLVPNLFDSTIVVHSADGDALGSISDTGRWFSAPGAARAIAPSRISNLYLRRVVADVLARGSEVGSFRGVLANALERIQPEFRERHRALSLLAARPIAVVRARLRLELLGDPPVDQSWSAFRRSLRGGGRSDAGLRAVRFPLRIGEAGQLDDGVVGFWVEEGDGFAGGRFHAPQGPADGDERLHAGGGQLTLTLDSSDVTVTMLVDPRATVHATTGILPTKVLRIPDAQFESAMERISVTFLTAPLLTPPGSIAVSVPPVPGYAWSWTERTQRGWIERSDDAVHEPETRATLGAAHELREGWLTLRRSTLAEEEEESR